MGNKKLRKIKESNDKIITYERIKTLTDKLERIKVSGDKDYLYNYEAAELLDLIYGKGIVIRHIVIKEVKK